MKKRSLLLLMAVILTVTLLAPMTASAATYYHVSGTSFVKLRALPDKDADVIASYRQDYAVVTYRKYNKDWAKISFSDGTSGYVMRKYLKSSSSFRAYVTTDKTHVRIGPAASFSSLGTLNRGSRVTVMTTGSAWDYVSTNIGTGYIRKSFLSKDKVSASPNLSVPYTAYIKNPAGNNVNVRRGPGKGYAVAGELEPKTKVSVTWVEGGWSNIEVSGGPSGWVMNEYITRSAPAPTPTLEPGTTPTPKPEPGYRAYIKSPNGKKVNMRHGPSEKGYAVRAQLEPGTEIRVLSTENGWCKIKAGVVGGWVKKEYVTKTKPSSSGSGSSSSGSGSSSSSSYKSWSGTVKSENGRKINVRRGAGKGYANVTQVESGKKVTVVGETTNWYEVNFDGMHGWISKEYVTK